MGGLGELLDVLGEERLAGERPGGWRRGVREAAVDELPEGRVSCAAEVRADALLCQRARIAFGRLAAGRLGECDECLVEFEVLVAVNPLAQLLWVSRAR